MKTIWTTTIDIDDVVFVKMPALSEPISVGVQNGEPVIWWYVPDTEHPKIHMELIIIGTGHPITVELEDYKFIGTFQIGGFVGHLFIEKRK